jgi:hypothetical protein
MNQAYRGGIRLLSSAVRVALGAGAVLGSSYIFSRLKERHSMESRLDRLEQAVDKLSAAEEEGAGSRRGQEQ